MDDQRAGRRTDAGARPLPATCAGTELLLTHERFALEATREHMHLQGWAGCLDKLEALLAA